VAIDDALSLRDIDAFDPAATCAEMYAFLAAHAAEHRAGCTEAAACVALAHVVPERPEPSCGCKWFLEPAEHPGETFAAAAEAASDDWNTLVLRLESYCRSAPGVRWGRVCDTPSAWPQVECEGAECRAPVEVDPTPCSAWDGGVDDAGVDDARADDGGTEPEATPEAGDDVEPDAGE
jgi:hypothetical protein